MARGVGTTVGLMLAASLGVGLGCQASALPHADPHPPAKAGAEPYMVEAPDVLRIDAPRLVPLPAHRVGADDSLYLVAHGTSVDGPVNGIYPVGPDGAIDLGPVYGGPLKVAGLTATGVEEALTERLAGHVEEPAVDVCLAHAHGADAVRGEHLVRPDGTIRLGPYGAVSVAGRSLPQVRAAVESHLRRFLDRPEVSVTVSAPNSKAVAGVDPDRRP